MQERGDEQRSLFRRWPAGVSVVVAEVGGRRAALTVSSLASLSLEPPLVGISIALEASLHELIKDAETYGTMPRGATNLRMFTSLIEDLLLLCPELR